MDLEKLTKIVISSNKKMAPSLIVSRIQEISGYDIERSLKGYYQMKEKGLLKDVLVDELEEVLLRDIRLLELSKAFNLKIESCNTSSKAKEYLLQKKHMNFVIKENTVNVQKVLSWRIYK